jgi:uncharacterized membrane protein YbhN (UPF0104 family)
LQPLAAKIPSLALPARFAEAAAWSIATQLCVAIAGWVLLHAIEPRVSLAESLLIVPLAAATTFLPITVGGAGAREAVYVTLGAALFEMPREDAFAASLALWLAHLVVGAGGGLLVLSGRSR